MRRVRSQVHIITPAAWSLMYSRGRSVPKIPATGPVRVYKAGESFFEPPGSHHLISENASEKEPATLLAMRVADDGTHLTTFDK